MKYFYKINELHGTDCHEFFKGKWNGTFWSYDSIYIYDEDFSSSGLKRVISCAVPDYSPYADSEINSEMWGKICSEAKLSALEAVKEASFWVKEALDEHGIFTILGI